MPLFACLFAAVHIAGAITVNTEYGPVSGVEHSNGVVGFLGVPFAAPPVGHLRFARPEPPIPWTVVRKCEHFAPSCLNPAKDSGPEGNSEDCLYVNVFVPPNASEPLPVMVYVYGGGFLSGSTSYYPGWGLAHTAQVIVVSVAYRVNGFGFLATHALHKAFGLNSGLFDQQFGLHWVSRNIAAFGGDPAKVTIFGQSSGGASIGTHLVMKGSFSYYTAAIVQSPGPLSGATVDSSDWQTLATSLELGESYAAEVGCSNITEDQVACLQALDAAVLLDNPVRSPVVDGVDFELPPLQLMKAGRFNPVPTVVGTTQWESGSGKAYSVFKSRPPPLDPPPSDASYTNALGKVFGANYSVVQGWYASYAQQHDSWRALARAVADSDISCTVHFLSNELANAARAPVYRYEFVHGTRDWDRFFLNGTHAGELAYVFLNVSVPGNYLGYRSFDESEWQLATSMARLWGSFATHHSPSNVSGVPEWEQYNTSSNLTMIFDTKENGGIKLLPSEAWKTCPLWENWVSTSPPK